MSGEREVVFFTDWGSGSPLLLVHGVMISGEMFEPVVEHFAAGHRVIVPDLRGHGRSRGLPPPYRCSVTAKGVAMARARVATFDAVGGPAELEKRSDGYWAGPTDAGTYRVARCGRHSSPSYPVWSKIRWGSEVKEEGAEIKVKHDGKWQPLSKLSPTLTKQDVMMRNLELWNKYEIPAQWRFNDFGHITCYFYKDVNGNGRIDKDERIHTEYFHTTPDDEAATAAGKPVELTTSHGCIHLKPNDIDQMIAKGYFKSGNTVVIHRYDERVPSWMDDSSAGVPFEVHFFPGAKKVVVTGRRSHRRLP